MKLSVVYATTEGHTRNIAEFIGRIINSHHHTVDIHDSATAIHLSKTAYDGVIVGGSVHQGQHQISLRNFIFENLSTLNEMPCAFFSVSLVAAIQQDIYQHEAQDYVSTFLEAVGWKPLESLTVAGALNYNEYDYFKRMVLKLLAGQLTAGIVAGKDTVYTDWDKVKTFVENFLEHVSSLRNPSDFSSFGS